MPSSCADHSIALVLGTILRTIDSVQHHVPCGIPHFAELNALQNEECGILYLIISVPSAFSTGRCVGSCAGCVHSWDNLRTTQCAARYTRSEQ